LGAADVIVSYCKGNSALHRLNPLAKLSAIFAGCTMLFLLDGLVYAVAGLAVVVAIAAVTGVHQVLSLARSKFASILLLWLIVANAVFVPGGNVLVSIPFHFFRVTITDLGLLTGCVMALRFLTILLMSGLFIVTTDPAALVYSLMKRGLPYRYGFMLIVMLRFATVFEREVKTVTNAQKMRGLEIDRRGVRKIFQSIRYTFVPLIVSAFTKVDGLVLSMEGRAFGCKGTRTFLAEDRYTRRDKALIVVSLAVIILLLLDKATGWYPLPSLVMR
jgi:energy-coupling factor transport system permease protein